MRVRRWLAPVATGAVLAVALAIGSGAFDAPEPSRQATIAAIERDVRCPACVDLSVAQSEAPSSIALRDQIVREVDQGETSATILDGIVARYGPGALLEPPDGGLDTILWAVPIALGLGAVASLGAVLVRRRGA